VGLAEAQLQMVTHLLRLLSETLLFTQGQTPGPSPMLFSPDFAPEVGTGERSLLVSGRL
jgi:hypothetical protein